MSTTTAPRCASNRSGRPINANTVIKMERHVKQSVRLRAIPLSFPALTVALIASDPVRSTDNRQRRLVFSKEWFRALAASSRITLPIVRPPAWLSQNPRAAYPAQDTFSANRGAYHDRSMC